MIAVGSVGARGATLTNSVGVTVVMDEGTGEYAVESKSTGAGWMFSGSLRQALKNVKTVEIAEEAGMGPASHVVQGELSDDVTVAIRVFDDLPNVIFSWTTKHGTEVAPVVFPSFNALPGKLHALSYSENHFADPSFTLQETSTPYVLFDDAANTAVISPAKNFLVARMAGRLDGGGAVTSALNKDLRKLPAGFSHETLMTFGTGIHETFLAWGKALSSHLRSPRPSIGADAVQRYLGYWTDNGAFYYYNYDPQKGYAGTLVALADHYREKRIPLRYLQLDSWWYQKSLTDYKGALGKPKNAKLPEGSWNRYGGTLEYSAHPDLFPEGLGAWQKKLDLPLVVHARWIDLDSPYRQKYAISGVVPVDAKYWNDIASYLQQSGVICYEQDWLNFMYDYSPELQTTVDAGNKFADGMAKAFQNRGMTIQYCMAPARFFLQGAMYPNLTTIRVSDDRFERKKWNNFLYTSMLAQAVGRWPWVDVFKSTETENLLLSVLSAGPVGVGDEMGKESNENLMMAVRGDGVIVKPDAPIVPVDATVIADAAGKHQAFLAATSTVHEAGKTVYAFAYARESDGSQVTFTPASLGEDGAVYVYTPATHSVKLLQAGDTFSDTLAEKGAAFYELVPMQKNGIAFAGDEGKFVGTGKQRVSEIAADENVIVATVLAAPGESAITLHGFAEKAPAVVVNRASADAVAFDAANHHWRVTIHPDESAPLDRFSADDVHRIEVRVAAK